MLGIVEIEGGRMCLGFFFGFICIVVGKRVANVMKQGIQVPREYVHLKNPQGKRGLVDKLLQTVAHFSLIALLDKFLEKTVKSLGGYGEACAKFIIARL